MSRGPSSSRSAAATPGSATANTPIFVDVAQLVPVMYVVAGFLVVFSALVMYADIVKPISLAN